MLASMTFGNFPWRFKCARASNDCLRSGDGNDPHLRGFRFTCALSISMAALLSASGCTTARVGGPLTPTDSDYPSENRSAARNVRVQGSIPRSLDLKLDAAYMAVRRTGCTETPTFIAGAVSGATFPMTIRVPMEIARVGSAYTADFAVDRFHAGRCGWHFFGVIAEVSKAGRSHASNSIVRVAEAGTKEGSGYNSRNTPVIWRCRSFAASGFACLPSDGDKYLHLLNSTSTSVDANFIDEDAP